MIILDSSFLIAFHNENDIHHRSAAKLMPQLIVGNFGQLLMPEYVYLEVVTVVALKRDFPTAIKVGSALLNAKEIQFVPCSHFFQDAWRYFQSQGTGAVLSFIDAALVALAKQRGVRHLATFDKGFQKVPEFSIQPPGQ
jgi:predicted nucleic acid-binding protein